uniref:Receptor L-domain domain-containing protein n=1 Tax=Panagrolaimus sp. JU765 TaxID=591449 RepID=A0AC34QL54_9BILA
MKFYVVFNLFFGLNYAAKYHYFDNTLSPVKISERGDDENFPLPNIIIGNLILTNVDKSIWTNGYTVKPEKLYEITGYLHLNNIDFDINFPNLVVIHGEELEPETGAALLIENCKMSYLKVPNLQVIKKGKVVIRNCSNLCFWNPNEEHGVDYQNLVRPTQKDQEVNSKIQVVNSFENCQDKLSCKWKSRCYAPDILQKRPLECGSAYGCYLNPNSSTDAIMYAPCPKGCAIGCRLEANRFQCNTCPENHFLSLRNGLCDICNKTFGGLYCLDTEIDDKFIVKEDNQQVRSCSFGYTLNGKDECERCHVDIISSEKMYPSCLKVCPGEAFPTYEDIHKLYPGFTLTTYDQEVEYEEHELCSILVGQTGYQLERGNEFVPPQSSLWFTSRLQYSDWFSPFNQDSDRLFFGNLRKGRFYNLNDDFLDGNSWKYMDFGVLEPENHGIIKEGSNQWFLPLKKNSRFNGKFSSADERNKDFDCRCGFQELLAKNDECFVPGNCYKCIHGHRQYIDPQTKVMFTRCSKTPMDSSIEFRTDENARPPNTIFPCNKACKEEGCSDKTVFGCKKCKKLDIWTHNLARACVLKCPVGFYKEQPKNVRCQRCHKACRGGCTGPAAGRGKGGCNDCFSFITAPNDSKFDVICMSNANSDQPELLVVKNIIRHLARGSK